MIKGVTRKNAGTYTCRARVPQTGELEERDVRLDVSGQFLGVDCMQFSKVQEPPNWVLKPSNVRGVEMEKIEFKCQALGSPNPKYTWVDKEGIDATEKEGPQFGPKSTNWHYEIVSIFFAFNRPSLTSSC